MNCELLARFTVVGRNSPPVEQASDLSRKWLVVPIPSCHRALCGHILPVGWYCGTQGPMLGDTMDGFSPCETHIALSSTMTVLQKERSFPVDFSLIFMS